MLGTFTGQDLYATSMLYWHHVDVSRPSDPRTQPSLVTKGTAILALPWRRAVTLGPVPVPLRLSWQRSLERLWALRDEATLVSWHPATLRSLQVSLNAVLQSLENRWRYSLLLLSLLEPDASRPFQQVDLTSGAPQGRQLHLCSQHLCAMHPGPSSGKALCKDGGFEKGCCRWW